MIGLVLLGAGKSQRFIKSLTNVDITQHQESLKTYHESFNKIFIQINGKMIWEYSYEVFKKFRDKITNVVFVLNPQTIKIEAQIISQKIDKSDFESIDFTEGGEKRQDSVYKGLEILKNKYLDYVIVHDLARPFIPEEDVKKLIESIKDFDGATLYCLPKDSVASNYDNNLTYLPRQYIYLIKTPQIFKMKALVNAHEELRKENLDIEFTDDISLLDFYLFNVGFVEGSSNNIKLTTFEDFILLKSLLILAR
ncbi:MAG: IspD/TarI family cytidylyltransferase [bacterium]